MKSKPLVWWIDDYPKRRKTSNSLKQRTRFDVRFCDAKNTDMLEIINMILNSKVPDAIVIDHILNNTKGAVRFLDRGTSIAEQFKERFPSCLIVGVSGIDNEKDVGWRSSYVYDDMYFDSDFITLIERFACMSSGFHRLSDRRTKAPKDLLRLLSPPRSDLARLSLALPEQLRAPELTPERASLFHSWIREKLFARSGFLMDSLVAATHLGVNEKAFDLRRPKQTDALYRGVFAFKDHPLWWKSLLQPPHKVAEEDLAICYKCDRPGAEIVGHVDAKSPKRVPLHLRCSVPHPRHLRELYFDDVRIMSDE